MNKPMTPVNVPNLLLLVPYARQSRVFDAPANQVARICRMSVREIRRN
jgi:hypothetical protein